MAGAEIIDREFAAKFLRAADAPLDYGVYLLFHDWWAEAPQQAIEAYSRELASIPEAGPLLASRYISEPFRWAAWPSARRARWDMPIGALSWTTSSSRTWAATIGSSTRN